MEPHGLTAMVPTIVRRNPPKHFKNLPSLKLRQIVRRIHPRAYARGLLRRRIKDLRKGPLKQIRTSAVNSKGKMLCELMMVKHAEYNFSDLLRFNFFSGYRRFPAVPWRYTVHLPDTVAICLLCDMRSALFSSRASSSSFLRFSSRWILSNMMLWPIATPNRKTNI